MSGPGFREVLHVCRRSLARGEPDIAAELIRGISPEADNLDDLIALTDEDLTGRVRKALGQNGSFLKLALSQGLSGYSPQLCDETGIALAPDDILDRLHDYRGQPLQLVALLSEASRLLDAETMSDVILHACEEVAESGMPTGEVCGFLQALFGAVRVSDQTMGACAKGISTPIDGDDAVAAAGALSSFMHIEPVAEVLAGWLGVAKKASAEHLALYMGRAHRVLGIDDLKTNLLHLVSRMAEKREVAPDVFGSALAALGRYCNSIAASDLPADFHNALIRVLRQNPLVIPVFVNAAPMLSLWKCAGERPVEANPVLAEDDDIALAAWLYALGEKSIASETLLGGRKLNRVGGRMPPEVSKAGKHIVLAGQVFALEDAKSRGWLLVPDAPPDTENVLLVCERGADPSVYLSAIKQGQSVTLCTMDAEEKPFFDRVDSFWSLRDMSFDASDEIAEQTALLRMVSEAAVSNFVARQSLVRRDEVYSRYSRALAASLEDSLDGAVVVIRSMLNAVKAFEGKHVVLALRSNSLLRNFLPSFLKTGKTFYVTFGEHAKPGFVEASYGHTPAVPSGRPGALHDYLQSLDRVDFPVSMCRQEKEPDRTSAVIMTAFADPLYAENTLPLIRELSRDRAVTILEMGNPARCIENLEKEFGPAWQSVFGEGSPVRVFAPQEIFNDAQKLLTDPRAAMDELAGTTLQSFNTELSVNGLDFSWFLMEALSSNLFKTVHHFGLCSRLFHAYFAQAGHGILYAGSERAPIRMVAVEAAKAASMRTVDVMSVNTIRLPRYRPPAADYLTSIDTATTSFLSGFYGASQERIINTGSPRMSLILDKIRHSDTAVTRDILGVSDSTPIVLYACQLQPIKRCTQILEALLDSLQGNDAHLLVKLHRRENIARREIYLDTISQSGLADRVHVISDEEWLSNITNLMAISNVVVSMYSNALREAACFGVPVIAADWFETPLPFDFPAHGLGARAISAGQMVSLVKGIVSGDGLEIIERRNNRYMARNPQLTDGSAARRIADIAGL